jgi:CheY-like chemotaxis protein
MKPKVLVIEDNEQNLYLMNFILNHHGYEVIQARDGATALEVADKITPGLILLDIQLPEMDGYTVARRFRADPNFEDIPIIAVTSYAMLGDREKAIEAGCTGYIEKPINPDTFLMEMEKFVTPRLGGKHEQDPDR